MGRSQASQTLDKGMLPLARNMSATFGTFSAVSHAVAERPTSSWLHLCMLCSSVCSWQLTHADACSELSPTAGATPRAKQTQLQQ